MINAGVRVGSFNGTQIYNPTIKEWTGVVVEVLYPEDQNSSVNPISVKDKLVELINGVWLVTAVEFVSGNSFILNLKSFKNPSLEIKPPFGLSNRAAIITPNNGIIVPYWDTNLVSDEIEKIVELHNLETELDYVDLGLLTETEKLKELRIQDFQVPRGDTQTNENYTGLIGELCFDTETKEVRVHDGEQLGGFIVGYKEPVLEPEPVVENPVKFLGLVPASDFITGSALASMVGLSAGTLINDTTNWVKMNDHGTIILFPMKPIRHSANWSWMNTSNIVYGNRTVVIRGVEYKIRLFKGSDTDRQLEGSDGLNRGYNVESSRQSEWNRLMYQIHSGVHLDPENDNTGSYPYGTLAQFSDEELGLFYTKGKGSSSWCQEKSSTHDSFYVCRGFEGVTPTFIERDTYNYDYLGWRPILEEVPIKGPGFGDLIESKTLSLVDSDYKLDGYSCISGDSLTMVILGSLDDAVGEYTDYALIIFKRLSVTEPFQHQTTVGIGRLDHRQYQYEYPLNSGLNVISCNYNGSSIIFHNTKLWKSFEYVYVNNVWGSLGEILTDGTDPLFGRVFYVSNTNATESLALVVGYDSDGENALKYVVKTNGTWYIRETIDKNIITCQQDYFYWYTTESNGRILLSVEEVYDPEFHTKPIGESRILTKVDGVWTTESVVGPSIIEDPDLMDGPIKSYISPNGNTVITVNLLSTVTNPVDIYGDIMEFVPEVSDIRIYINEKIDGVWIRTSFIDSTTLRGLGLSDSVLYLGSTIKMDSDNKLYVSAKLRHDFDPNYGYDLNRGGVLVFDKVNGDWKTIITIALGNDSGNYNPFSDVSYPYGYASTFELSDSSNELIVVDNTTYPTPEDPVGLPGVIFTYLV